MSEISGRVIGLIREGARRLEIDVESAESGLSFAGAAAPRWVPWTELVAFANRLTEGMSGEQIEDLGLAIARGQSIIHLGFRAMPTARLAVRLLWRNSEMIAEHLGWTVEERGDELRLGVRLDDGYEGCEPFFRMLLGQLREVPELAGLPLRAPVVLAVDDRRLELDLWLPPKPLDRAIESGARAVDRASTEFLGLVRMRFGRRKSPDPPSVEAIGRRLGLTETQSRIARLLAEGSDPQEIARELEISLHTVRTHLRTIYARTGANSQARLVSRVLLEQEPEPR